MCWISVESTCEDAVSRSTHTVRVPPSTGDLSSASLCLIDIASVRRGAGVDEHSAGEIRRARRRGQHRLDDRSTYLVEANRLSHRPVRFCSPQDEEQASVSRTLPLDSPLVAIETSPSVGRHRSVQDPVSQSPWTRRVHPSGPSSNERFRRRARQ